MAGRSGMGGGGGSHRSSGGGSRSRGSYGGGSRGGRSGISSGRSSSFGHSSFGYRPSPHHSHYGGYHHYPSYSHRTVVHTHSSPLSTLIAGIIVLVMIVMIYMPMSFSGFSGSITPSTIDREPLPKGSVVETEYFNDTAGWISNTTEMNRGLKHFYQETGVQPYVYITNEVDGSRDPSDAQMEEFTNQLYDELFEDEAHVLLVFQDADGHYSRWLVVGSQAKTVIDQEAADILFSYIDNYYYDANLSSEEFFSESFSDAADRMMTKTANPLVTIVMIVGVVVIVVVVGKVITQRIKHAKEEAERTERMLNMDLSAATELPTSPAVEDLENKYL